MKSQTITDNHNPEAKLELRRHFLRQMVSDGVPIRVLDCFMGEGLLWRKLRSEFPIHSYWGVDLKPKKGRLQIDSSRILAQPGWAQNVVDLDAYGSPWNHWINLVQTSSGSVTVFLTIGMVRSAGGNYDHAILDLSGARFRRLKIPNTLGVKLSGTILPHALAFAESNGFDPVDIQEAFPQKNARYIGVRLVKRDALAAHSAT
jgi:hypothetical protein